MGAVNMRIGRTARVAVLVVAALALAEPAFAAPRFTCHTDFCDQVAFGLFSYAWILGAPALVVLFGLGAHDTRRPGERGGKRPTARYVVVAALFGLALSLAIDAAAREVTWPWWAHLAAPVAAVPVVYVLGRWRLIG